MLARWRRRLQRLRTLDARAWAALLVAQWALLRAQMLVWTRPAGRLVTPETGGPPADAGDSQRAEARRLALAIERAAEHGLFRPKCLARAVALHRLLEARRMPGSRIRIGVRHVDGRFTAHAWVEYAGMLLGDREYHVRAFTPVTDVTAPRA